LVVSKARVSLLVSIVTTEPVSDNTSLSFSSKETEIKKIIIITNKLELYQIDKLLALIRTAGLFKPNCRNREGEGLISARRP